MKRSPRSLSRTITALVAGAVILALCQPDSSPAQDKPGWAEELPNLPQRPGWYQGLGITKATADGAADWNDAMGKARAQISAQIRVRVANTVSRAVQETASETAISIAEAYASTTEQITAATIEGVAMERWYDEDTGTLYAYGAISQAEVERRFREKMEDALASARVYHAGARRALERNDPFTAMGQIAEAIMVVGLAEATLDRTLSTSLDGEGRDVPVMPVLQTQMCGMLSRLHFEVLEGDGQEAERGKGLGSPLRGRVSFRSDRGTYPVRNAVLLPTFVAPASGRVPEDVRTDETGSFELTVIEVKNGESVNRVRLTPGIAGMAVLIAQSPDLARCLATAYMDFSFRMKSRTNITLAIRVLEKNMGTPRPMSTVQEEIHKSLIDSEYSILDDSRALDGMSSDQVRGILSSGEYGPILAAVGKHADVAIIGEASAEARGNPYPQIYFGAGRTVLRILDCRTGRVLGNVILEDQKEGGSSFEQAGRKVLEKMGRTVAQQVREQMRKALE